MWLAEREESRGPCQEEGGRLWSELDRAWKPAPPTEWRSLSPKAKLLFCSHCQTSPANLGTPEILSWTICGRIAVGLEGHKEKGVLAGWDDGGL